jgi:RNA polymerase sigma-70 factor (ECF subfamily)
MTDKSTDKTTNDRRFEAEALRWLPDVARYALSLTRSESDADDLVQDAFLIAYQQWHQFQEGTECRAWLFTICRHRFYRLQQREERQLATEDPELEALAAAAIYRGAKDAGLENAFARSSVLQSVDAAIAELPPQFRDVAILVDVEDQSYESAAQILGVPIGTVRSRLFRARRILQEKLLAHAQDAGFRSATGVSNPEEFNT